MPVWTDRCMVIIASLDNMPEYISNDQIPTLVDIVRPWPVARSLSSQLAADDLVALARSSTALRASLHGFALAEPLPNDTKNEHVRDSIHVGMHGTLYWQNLKHATQRTCSSKSHTKGDKVHSCRLCSALICEACIVRSSFARGKEDTFRNRCRFFCETCWERGNNSRSKRHPLRLPGHGSASYDETQGDHQEEPFCTCTLKENGWLCLECKDKQNYGAVSNGRFRCHGEGCLEPVGPDHEKRRICLWCDKTLPRHLGVSRLEWNQKIIEARTRNALSRQADLEEYNRKRMKLMRMSRRELRGDQAVTDDPEADKPQFVRHLDSCCNYRNFMSETRAPDGTAVYDSKRGYWRYSKAFLLEIGERCKNSKQLGRNHGITRGTWSGTSVFARTIRQCDRERDYLIAYGSRDTVNGTISSVYGKNIWPFITSERATLWVALKTRILDMAFIQQMEFFQMQAALQLQYDFDLPWAEFKSMLNVWCLTPLWGVTDEDQPAKGKGPSKRPTIRLASFKRAPKEPVVIERKIEHHAARIIERLVLAGYALPLRTAMSVSDEQSHWHDDTNASYTDHLSRVHPCSLLEESSDEEIEEKDMGAAHAGLPDQFKKMMRHLNHRRPVRQGRWQPNTGGLGDRRNLHTRGGPDLRLTPADLFPGLDSDIADPARRPRPTASVTGRQRTAEARQAFIDDAQGVTVPAHTGDRRSSFSSTSDDFDDDDVSFKSFDSDDVSKNDASADQRHQPDNSNITVTNDDDWEIVPPPEPEGRSRD